MLPDKLYELNAESVRSHDEVLTTRLKLSISVLALLMCCAGSALAQHTAVVKNGVGGRIETDFNAADKATEMRTIGPDGKLQQKVNYEYLPGYYVPQQTDTTYWPNGNLRKVSRHTYDESSNFTGEFIQVFDETGKQISGHKLIHEPRKGTYRCAEWDAMGRGYRARACPSGEEEGSVGGGGGAKRFTYDEVMKYLELARKGTARETTGSGAAASPATARNEVGLILPSHFRRGGRVSGILVQNSEQYDDIPDVNVTRIRVPFESGGEGSRLAGWRFEAPGEEPRPADGPITFIVPAHGSLRITLRQNANAGHSVSKELSFSQAPTKGASSTPSFEAPALCMKGELCAVSGGFSGDSSKDFAAFEERAATIVAETEDAAYIRIPDPTEPGPRPLFIAAGSGEEAKVAAFPVVVGRLSIRDNGREVRAGETVITSPMLEGPSGVADPVWEVRDLSKSKMERARQLVPGFTLNGKLCEGQETEPKVEREQEVGDTEKQESEEEKGKERDDAGKILLVLKNLAPKETLLHGAHNDTVAFCLGDEAFQRGDFKYNLRVDARKAGKITLQGSVISFLAPVAGQELRVKETQ